MTADDTALVEKYLEYVRVEKRLATRTVDDKLREYVTFFSPSAKGVFIPEPALADAAAAWGVGYQKSDVKNAATYQVDHTSGVYLVDREGRRRVVWDYTQLTRVDRVVADVREVMR